MAELVRVPKGLLCSPVLSPPARLVWMAAAGLGETVGVSRLGGATGLARNTVRRALADLAAAGWPTSAAGAPPEPSVPVPVDLLVNSRLGLRARLLYGYLLLLPGFSQPSGWFRYAELATLAGMDVKTVRQGVFDLAEEEWIRVEQARRLDPVYFELTFPGRERALTTLSMAERRLEKPGPYGEKLMREYLSLLVDLDQFEDNATPGWLVNPRTQERLQLDRFYPPGVGFEFNGVQHYRETERYSSEQVRSQQERDYIKLGICAVRGVTLVVVHPEDLTLAGMRQKVGSLLPLRDLTDDGLLISYLEDERERYRRSVARI